MLSSYRYATCYAIKGGPIASDARKAFPSEIILKNACVKALAWLELPNRVVWLY